MGGGDGDGEWAASAALCFSPLNGTHGCIGRCACWPATQSRLLFVCTDSWRRGGESHWGPRLDVKRCGAAQGAPASRHGQQVDQEQSRSGPSFEVDELFRFPSTECLGVWHLASLCIFPTGALYFP